MHEKKKIRNSLFIIPLTFITVIILFASSFAQAQLNPESITPFDKDNITAAHTKTTLAVFVQSELIEKNPDGTGRDLYFVTVRVENVGKITALDTTVELKSASASATSNDIPSDWEIHPGEKITIGDIPAERGKKVYFHIFKGPTNATLYAVADAKNSNPVISEPIPVPINILVALGVLASFSGMVMISRKAKGK